METNSPSSDIRKLAELIKDVRVAFLITKGPEGQHHGRPMYTLGIDPETFYGDLWFFTDRESIKVHEVQADPRVMLTLAHEGKNRYILLHAEAYAEHDPARAEKLWNIHAKAWWPEGPQDPSLALLRVAVRSAEYWDGPSNTSYMISLAKAVISGERIEAKGDHGSVRMA